jgi:hypothetical protein
MDEDCRDPNDDDVSRYAVGMADEPLTFGETIRRKFVDRRQTPPLSGAHREAREHEREAERIAAEHRAAITPEREAEA